MVRSRGALLILLLVSVTACATDKSPRPSLEGRAVDRDPPVFSNPTAVTNALFPASLVTQVVQLGVDGGQPLRVEVTLMPETRSIAWNGGAVETVVVQFIAYRDRRVIEVAYDYFAQADDGSVWYFGEVVDNYGGGIVSNHSGSWLAGEDGPPGMIMPASPAVGDVYHPENIPGVVFEELTVLETGMTIDGPSGPIHGVIRVEEHLMDGGMEQKLWAPGYGEFRTEAANELVTVAVASPTDVVPGPTPPEVLAMRAAATRLVDALAAGGSPDTVAGDIAAVRSAWDAYRSVAPPLVADEIQAAVQSLEQPSERAATSALAVRQAGIDVLLAVGDLELRFRQPAMVDRDRIAAWMRQLHLDAEIGEASGVVGDAAVAGIIWDRARHTVDAAAAERIGSLLKEAIDAAGAGDLDAVQKAASDLVGAISGAASG